MQQIKDSFYMALRDRLALVSPSRVVANTTRPAVLVCENEKENWLAEPQTFYLRWLGEGTVAVDAVPAGWQSLRCEIGYSTLGSDAANGVDRGRLLATLDAELREMLTPRRTGLKDYSTSPETDLGTVILWSAPKLRDAKDDLRGLQRTIETEILWREAV